MKQLQDAKGIFIGGIIIMQNPVRQKINQIMRKFKYDCDVICHAHLVQKLR